MNTRSIQQYFLDSSSQSFVQCSQCILGTLSVASGFKAVRYYNDGNVFPAIVMTTVSLFSAIAVCCIPYQPSSSAKTRHHQPVVRQERIAIQPLLPKVSTEIATDPSAKEKMPISSDDDNWQLIHDCL